MLVEKSNNFRGESLVYFVQNLEQNLLTTHDTEQTNIAICLSVCLCMIMCRQTDSGRDRKTNRQV